jgi:hypothetical protein
MAFATTELACLSTRSMLPWPRNGLGYLEENDRTIQFEPATIEGQNFILLRDMEGITLFINGAGAAVDRCSVLRFVD